MSKPIEITPALLADLRERAKDAIEGSGPKCVSLNLTSEEASLQSSVNPAVVLAMLDLIDELAGTLNYMAAQHECSCEHPACKRCADDRENVALLKKVKGGAE